jgi:hypothetical protein
MHTSAPMCRYGYLCKVPSCGQPHPRVNRTPCKYGDGCHRAQCSFTHPPTRNVCLHETACRIPGCARLHPPGFAPPAACAAPASAVARPAPAAPHAARGSRRHDGAGGLALVRRADPHPSLGSPAAPSGGDALALALRALPGANSTTSTVVSAHVEVVTTAKPQRANVVVALDVSGSMAGDKLAAALQCLRDLDAACLKAGDTLSVVTFNHTVTTVMPVAKKTPSARARRSKDAALLFSPSAGQLKPSYVVRARLCAAGARPL